MSKSAAASVEQEVSDSSSTSSDVSVRKAGEPRFADVEQPDVKKLKFEKTFYFECELNGRTYSGNFTCRRLTIGSSGQVEVLKQRLNGGQLVAPDVDALHYAVAYLQYALVASPEAWWKPNDFYEEEAPLLRQIYDYVRHWESSFRSPPVR